MASRRSLLLDLNNPAFQAQLFDLDAADIALVFSAFQKLAKLDWTTLQQHKGFHWEDAGHRSPAPNGSTIKSIRLNQKARALAYRDGDFIRFLSLHLDHDGAYR